MRENAESSVIYWLTCRLFPIIYELVLLAFTIYKATEYRRMARSAGMADSFDLMKVLVRDQIVFGVA